MSLNLWVMEELLGSSTPDKREDTELFQHANSSNLFILAFRFIEFRAR